MTRINYWDTISRNETGSLPFTTFIVAPGAFLETDCSYTQVPVSMAAWDYMACSASGQMLY